VPGMLTLRGGTVVGDLRRRWLLWIFTNHLG